MLDGSVGAPGRWGLTLGVTVPILLVGLVVASLVRSGPHHGATWSAELLLDLDQKDRPPPFRRLEHQFATFEEARNWLGNPEIASEP